MTLTLQDREKLIDGVKFYAVKLAKQYYKKSHSLFDFEDVIQAAMLGASEAAYKYDDQHASKANFMTYAAAPMLNRVITLYRTSTPAHIPRRDYDAMPHNERGRRIWGSHVTLSDPAYRNSDNEDTSLADLLQDEDGQILEGHSISAGLDYPGIGRLQRIADLDGDRVDQPASNRARLEKHLPHYGP